MTCTLLALAITTLAEGQTTSSGVKETSSEQAPATLGDRVASATARFEVQRPLPVGLSSGLSSRFEVTTHEVLVPVTVVDEQGRLITGLGASDFRVYEDGVEQELDLVLAEKAPLTVGIVLDLSASMSEKMEGTRLALSRFVDCLEPEDRAFLLAFNDSVIPLQGPTSDRGLLLGELSRLQPDGGTALFDAIVEGLYRLHRSEARKRALVVVSDGMDNSSLNTARDAIAASKATGIPIYTIGPGKMKKRLFSRWFGDPLRDAFRQQDDILLRELAARTGGRALFLSEMKEKGKSLNTLLGEAFERVAMELRSLYLLSYRPRRLEMDGRWHHIEVRVLPPGWFTRFRPAYLAVNLR